MEIFFSFLSFSRETNASTLTGVKWVGGGGGGGDLEEGGGAMFDFGVLFCCGIVWVGSVEWVSWPYIYIRGFFYIILYNFSHYYLPEFWFVLALLVLCFCLRSVFQSVFVFFFHFLMSEFLSCSNHGHGSPWRQTGSHALSNEAQASCLHPKR